MHTSTINVSNFWVVLLLDLPKSKRLHNILECLHLSDIKTPTGNYDVTVLIGAEVSLLH